jgi:hypothetical protein
MLQNSMLSYYQKLLDDKPDDISQCNSVIIDKEG